MALYAYEPREDGEDLLAALLVGVPEPSRSEIATKMRASRHKNQLAKIPTVDLRASMVPTFDLRRHDRLETRMEGKVA